MYDDPAKRNPALTYTQNAEGGFYTHYIDNTNPNATDTANPYGTVAKPRLTIPTAGSVVEVHGTIGGAGRLNLNVFGIKEKPVFIRGPNISDRPLITKDIRYTG